MLRTHERDTAWAPWFVARSDEKRRARLNIIEHILSSIPYEDLPRDKVKIPKRHISASDEMLGYPLRYIAEVF